MKKVLMIIAFLLMLAPVYLLAQQAAEVPEFDITVVEAILAGVGGFGVIGLTEMIKRLFKAGGIWGYVISAAVSIAMTSITLVLIHKFTLVAFIIYSGIVFVEANGFFKFIRKPTSGRVPVS